MEVTRKNFKETLPLIEASIERADFLVIDTEFTGLMNGREISIFDTPAEYYTKVLNSSSEFLLIQFGLCAFCFDEAENQYMNEAYNFYLFPRGSPGPEKMFLCQSSSLDFLAAQGFDFNKLIREGISYMTRPTEMRLREALTERQKNYTSVKQEIPIPEENKQQITDICKRVKQFLNKNEESELVIDRCNAFIRRLLFQELDKQFKDEVFLESRTLDNKDRVIVVTRLSTENDNLNEIEERTKRKEWEEFEDAVGFSKVAQMISESGKLVVGHNMILDVLHTLNHFFQPLPEDYSSFKEFAHCMFPKLLDTKYMSSVPPFKDEVKSSVLQHLYATLSEPPFSLVKVGALPGRGYSSADVKHHEAGYDAYVTGACFLAMRARLAAGPRAQPDEPALRPYVGKLYLSKTAHQDTPYMNINGDDPNPPRDHVFYFTFPKEWQRNEINQLFSPYGAVTVQFLTETSALVALVNRRRARDVMKALARHDRIKLVPYVQYKMAGKMTDDRHHWQFTSKVSTAISRPESKVHDELPEKPKVEDTKKSPVIRHKKNSSSQAEEPEPVLKITRQKNGTNENKEETLNSEEEESGPSPKKRLKKTKSKEKIEKLSPQTEVQTETTPAWINEDDSTADGRTAHCVTVFKESDSWA